MFFLGASSEAVSSASSQNLAGLNPEADDQVGIRLSLTTRFVAHLITVWRRFYSGTLSVVAA
jgi:hypothetical protein